MSNLTSEQAVRWLQSLRDNLTAHRRRRKITDQEKLAFLSEQYHQLYLLHKAIHGRVVFVGTTPLGEDLTHGQ